MFCKDLVKKKGCQPKRILYESRNIPLSEQAMPYFDVLPNQILLTLFPINAIMKNAVAVSTIAAPEAMLR